MRFECGGQMMNASWLCGLLAGALLLGGLGCSGKPVEMGTGEDAIATPQSAADADDLTLAFDALSNFADAMDRQEMERTLFYLNQWMGQGNGSIAYTVPKLAQQGPRQYVELLQDDKLSRASFSMEDLTYLRQASWFKSVASRQTTQANSPWLVKWLKDREGDLGATESQHLATADRLFDWTMRNIQLDETLPRPKEVAATVGTTSGKNAEDMPAPKRGVPGPGYLNLPWKTLIFGHGDAIERSRVFIHLMRQAGLDVVMLGVPDKDYPGTTRIWAAGVYIANQLYLFDAELGVPLPDETGKGILTLAEAVKSDGWLTALEARLQTKYRITMEDLKELQVYVEAEPESLSLRMIALENAIKERQAIKLTCNAVNLEADLAKQPNVVRVSLWRVPFEAYYFERAFPTGNNPSKYPEVARAMAIDLNLMMPGEKISVARDYHLRGELTSDGPKPKARQIYLMLRPPKRTMDALETSSTARKEAGFTESEIPKDPAKRAEYLAGLSSIVEKARLLKQRATFWVALTHMDEQNYQNAVEWLKDRILDGDDQSKWRQGARYNLGRCYEELGRMDEAIAVYRGEEGTQKLGDRVRASLLETMAK